MKTNADIEREYQRLLATEPVARQAWNVAESENFDDITKLKIIAIALGASLHNAVVAIHYALEKAETHVKSRQHQKVHPDQVAGARQDDSHGNRQEAMAQQ
jgi:hypothetical protein